MEMPPWARRLYSILYIRGSSASACVCRYGTLLVEDCRRGAVWEVERRQRQLVVVVMEGGVEFADTNATQLGGEHTLPGAGNTTVTGRRAQYSHVHARQLTNSTTNTHTHTQTDTTDYSIITHKHIDTAILHGSFLPLIVIFNIQDGGRPMHLWNPFCINMSNFAKIAYTIVRISQFSRFYCKM